MVQTVAWSVAMVSLSRFISSLRDLACKVSLGPGGERPAARESRVSTVSVFGQSGFSSW